jgi:hypothetical protein
MRTAPALTRSICAALLALLMAVRLLAPAGFMPSFDHGAVTIVACPDADGAGAPMAAHHEGHSKKLHQPCPYASASGQGSLAPDAPLLVAVVLLAAVLLVGRMFPVLERRRSHERPPLRGPPLPA